MKVKQYDFKPSVGKYATVFTIDSKLLCPLEDIGRCNVVDYAKELELPYSPFVEVNVLPIYSNSQRKNK